MVLVYFFIHMNIEIEWQRLNFFINRSICCGSL